MNYSRLQFNVAIANYQISCFVQQLNSQINTINFLIQQNKDFIKEIYKGIYCQANLLEIFKEEYFPKVQDLYNYIAENPTAAISVADLPISHSINIKVNIQDRIKQFPFKLAVHSLTNDQIIRRQNQRLKISLGKINDELFNTKKLLNQLKINQSFNNQEFQKMRLDNKKLMTQNRKLKTQKKTLTQQNNALKTKIISDVISVKGDQLSQHLSFVGKGQLSHIQPNSNSLMHPNSINIQDTPRTPILNSKKVNRDVVDLDEDEVISIVSRGTLQDQSVHSHPSVHPSIASNNASLLSQNPTIHSNNGSINSIPSVLSNLISNNSNHQSIDLSKLEQLSALLGLSSSLSKKQKKQVKKSAKNHKQYTYVQDNVSHILETKEQNDTLFNFFVRKIKTLKLLYRASQHEFDIGKFHRKSDGIKHTILLVLTQFGKKIGVYTPLEYKGLRKPLFYQDPNLQTFLFTISNKQKYKWKNSKKALFNSELYGPSFGRLNLHITDRSNLNTTSQSVYPYDFQNKFESAVDATSNLIGSQKKNFKILTSSIQLHKILYTHLKYQLESKNIGASLQLQIQKLLYIAFIVYQMYFN